jgi:hypothetical protein
MNDARQNRADQQAAVANLAAQQQQLQDQQATLAQQQQRLAAQQSATPPQTGSTAMGTAPASGGGVSQETISRLQQLGELQKQGILTPEEFAQQKAIILGS